MTTPAELQAIRERDARDFVSTKQYVAEAWPVTCREDRRTLLALYDAQSDEVRRLREALVTSRKVLVVACGEKAPFVRVALDVIDAALGSQP